MGSTSLHPQQLLHNVGGHAWSKQDGGNDDIELNLNLLHPALATLQLLFDGFISLIADRLMDGKLLFYGIAHQGIPVAVVGFFCAAICAANEASITSSPSLSLTHSIT